jgi:hypothetical protein
MDFIAVSLLVGRDMGCGVPVFRSLLQATMLPGNRN